MMKRHNNGISEEHIVAYLDGELNVNGEMREALGDAELLQTAKEYAMLKKIVAKTSGESRFQLTPSADSRARLYLASVLRGKTSTLNAPDLDAVPMARPARIATTKFWAKRSSIGLVLALFLGVLWFATRPNDEVAVPPTVADHTTQPQVVQPSAPPVIETPAPVVTNEPIKNTEVASHSVPVSGVKKSAKKTGAGSQNIAAITPTTEEKPAVTASRVDEQPNDIMISRRYAKLIKNVRVVEVTQQDKM